MTIHHRTQHDTTLLVHSNHYHRRVEGGSGGEAEFHWSFIKVYNSSSYPMEKNKQFKVVRVKRKREAEAPQDLVVYDHNDQRKNLSSTLTDGLSKLNLSGASCKRGLAHLEADLIPGHVPDVPHKRYKRLATMSGGEIKRATSQELENLLNQSAGPESISELGVAPLPSPSPSHPLLHQNARYEQVRARNGGSKQGSGIVNKNFIEDPLAKIAILYDVIRVETPFVTGSGDDQDLNLETDRNTPEIDAKQEICEEEAEEDYVYDIYIEAEEEGSSVDAWFDLHARGHAPVVHILQDDLWVVEEAYDGEESEDDTEDSNAEDYYANDYPEEGAYDSSSFDESEKQSFFCSKSGLRKAREWYDDSESDVS